jgi:hypothetical protein
MISIDYFILFIFYVIFLFVSEEDIVLIDFLDVGMGFMVSRLIGVIVIFNEFR